MRPGQTAPVFRIHGKRTRDHQLCFNEAGADCPGIPSSDQPGDLGVYASFNEAGADCPGIPWHRVKVFKEHDVLQ